MDQEQLQTAAAAPVATEEQAGTPPSGVPTENASPETEAPEVNWDSNDNPHYVRAQRAEAQAAQLAEQQAALNRHFAQQAREAEIARRNQLQSQFENGDFDARELTRRLNVEIEQVETRAQQQIEQALRPYWAQEYAEAIGRQSGLNADEVAELKQAPPESMPWAAQNLLQRRNYVPADRVANLETQLQQLQRNLAAGEVVNSGATRTLGANPTSGGQEPGTPQEKLRSFLRTYHPSVYEIGRG